ncbi:carboxyesterase-related protein, partial [Ochromonadaceae sp. CCMP2298]
AKMLFTYLIRGSRTWVVMTLRLVLFTIVLLPGWFQMLRYWLLSPLIIRNLRYGKGAKNRNLLDVYLPRPKPLAPVVIFVSGGAWTIGYKMWSALVARGLAKLGILCVVPDHRNFPQGDVQDMMDDVRLAVQWTVENAHRFGGDADKIVLSGQSAGAHVTLCLLVADFMKAQRRSKPFNVTPHVKLFIGVSGPYNLVALQSHFQERGLDASLLNWICRGDIRKHSPTIRLAEFAEAQNRLAEGPLAELAPIALFHGSHDATIPVSICTELADVLLEQGASASCRVYEGWSHTDAILEAPLSGTTRLFRDIAM